MRRRSFMLSTAAAALLAGGPGWADNFIPKAPGSDGDKKTPAKKKTGRKKSTKPARTPDPTAKAVADLVMVVALAEVLAAVSPGVNIIFGDLVKLARGYAALVGAQLYAAKQSAVDHQRLLEGLEAGESPEQKKLAKRREKALAKIAKEFEENVKAFEEERRKWEDLGRKTQKQSVVWRNHLQELKAAQSKAKAGARKGGFRTGQLRYDPKTGWHGGIDFGKQKITYDKTSKRWKGEGNLKPVARKLSWAEQARREVEARLRKVRAKIEKLKGQLTELSRDLQNIRLFLKSLDQERAEIQRLLKDPRNTDTNAKASALAKRVDDVLTLESWAEETLKRVLREFSKARAKYEAALREEMRLEATLKDLAKQK